MPKTTFRIFLILFTLFLNKQIFAANSDGMVVSSQHFATEIGYDVLQHGGNAIDAAVAIGYALAVVDPCCGNIGGGGFMLIHLANGKNVFLNFREKAPLGINQNLFLDKSGQPLPEKIQHGYLAVAVPGTVLGLSTALRNYGTLPLSELINPAIALAKNGFELVPGDLPNLHHAPADFYSGGNHLQQKNLAHSLEKIAVYGPQAFYQGIITDQIVKASQQQGGVLSAQDFAQYTVEEQTPITCTYHGYQIITAPPPSSGGVTLCEMLNITEPYPLHFWGYHKAFSTHYILEAMRYAYADRNAYLGDPDFINNPVARLLSPAHAQEIRQQINPFYAGNSQKIGFTAAHSQSEKPETTHYSVVDKYGNAVSVTYTLNGYFGSKVIAGNTGFFLNNEMDDFTLKPGVPNQFKLIQGSANAIAPGKRPLSSMTPTIVLKNNQVFMVLGAPGGSTIPTQVLETLENVIDYDFDLKHAVNLPRYHMQWLPDMVYTEPFAFSAITLEVLKLMGYQFQIGSPYNTNTWGAVAAILRDPISGKWVGAMDKRRPAGAVLPVT